MDEKPLLLTERDVRVEAARGADSSQVFNGVAFVRLQLSRREPQTREN